MDLIDFLKARIDEDEAAAALVTTPIYACDGHDRQWDCIAQPHEKWADGTDRLPNHHATWTPIYEPARVLADVAAKRAIVDDCGQVFAGDQPVAAQAVWVAGRALKRLAAVYADHPDYDERWRP